MKKAALDPITLKNDEFFLPEEGGLGGVHKHICQHSFSHFVHAILFPVFPLSLLDVFF